MTPLLVLCNQPDPSQCLTSPNIAASLSLSPTVPCNRGDIPFSSCPAHPGNPNCPHTPVHQFRLSRPSPSMPPLRCPLAPSTRLHPPSTSPVSHPHQGCQIRGLAGRPVMASSPSTSQAQLLSCPFPSLVSPSLPPSATMPSRFQAPPPSSPGRPSSSRRSPSEPSGLTFSRGPPVQHAASRHFISFCRFKDPPYRVTHCRPCPSNPRLPSRPPSKCSCTVPKLNIWQTDRVCIQGKGAGNLAPHLNAYGESTPASPSPGTSNTDLAAAHPRVRSVSLSPILHVTGFHIPPCPRSVPVLQSPSAFGPALDYDVCSRFFVGFSHPLLRIFLQLARVFHVPAFGSRGVGAMHSESKSGESARKPHHAEVQGPAFQPSLSRCLAANLVFIHHGGFACVVVVFFSAFGFPGAGRDRPPVSHRLVLFPCFSMTGNRAHAWRRRSSPFFFCSWLWWGLVTCLIS